MRRARIDERLHVGEGVEEDMRRDLRLQQMQSRVERERAAPVRTD
jgi:hypothetical protein